MDLLKLKNAISAYLPSEAVEICAGWITEYRFSLRITKSRTSKFGDYTPPQKGKGHRISLNHDLNPYAFLITFAHEVAHLMTWKRYGESVDPHGPEWKEQFRVLMRELYRTGVFPIDIRDAIIGYMRDPYASSCVDPHLMEALSKYDQSDNRLVPVKDITEDSLFRIQSGRVFVKGKLIRKNYSCKDVKNNHLYVIGPLVKVYPVEHNYQGSFFDINSEHSAE